MRTILPLLVMVLCGLSSMAVHAQDRCGFDQRLHHLLVQDPDFIQRLDHVEEAVHQVKRFKRNLQDEEITIPVVFHVLHKGEAEGKGTNISSDQIISSLEELNRAFQGRPPYTGPPSGIRFVLANRSPYCQPTPGINRVNAAAVCVDGDCYSQKGITFNNESAVKALSVWPAESYLNIWIVSEIEDNNAGSGIQGFAQFPGGDPSNDGVVMLYNAMGSALSKQKGYAVKETAEMGRILVHEVGHSLGLYHSFEGDDYNRDGYGDRCPSYTGCGPFNGDCVEDTPPHRRSTGDCNDTGTNVCDGGHSNERYIHNFMDYSSEACQTEFTWGQIQRMRDVLATSRMSWMYSNGDMPVAQQDETHNYCQPQTLMPENTYGLGVRMMQLGEQAIFSGSTAEDGGYRDNWCSTIYVDSDQNYAMRISTGELNAQNVAVYCDFNDDGDFDDRDELWLHSSNKKVHEANIRIPRHALKDRPLRLRVISAYAGFQISGACFKPYFGQVEDYMLMVDAVSPPNLPVVEFDTRDTNNQVAGTDVGVFVNSDQVHKSISARESQHFQVFPNPVTDVSVGVFSSEPARNIGTIELLNLSGQSIKMLDFDQQKQSIYHVDLPDLTSGLYYLRIRHADGVTTLKVVKS